MDREEIKRRKRELWYRYREKSHQWKENHKDIIRESNRRSREKDKKSWKAYIHNRCEYIIKKENLRPKECPICWWDIRISAHHPNYDKPHEIVFVCSPCHRKIHAWLLEISKSIIVDLNKYWFTKNRKIDNSDFYIKNW